MRSRSLLVLSSDFKHRSDRVETACYAPGPGVMSWGGGVGGSSRFLHRSPKPYNCDNLLPEKRRGPSVTVYRTPVHARTAASTSASCRPVASNDAGCGVLSPLSLPNEMQTLSPSPHQTKQNETKRNETEKDENKVRVKHLWRSSYSKGQRGSISLVTAPG
jgi:hypothetical protein